MEIESITHKALRNLFLTGNRKGLDAQIAPRLVRMLEFLVAVEAIHELATPPNFGAHLLKGDRAGEWSLTVTKNWRMTFKLNDDLHIIDLNLEDYHGS